MAAAEESSALQPKGSHQQWDEKQAGIENAEGKTMLILCSCMVALSGLLFGYDTGVVSGALLIVKTQMKLSNEQMELAVSMTTVFAVLGCTFASSTSIGRRPLIFISSLIFSIGGVGMGLAPSFFTLVLGRATVGVGIGIASVIAPVYLAEVSPKELRGSLTMMNTLLITVGQVLAGVVNGFLADVPGGWRWMFGLSAVPAVLELFGCFLLPESPRFLVQCGRKKKAEGVLKRIRGSSAVLEELDEISNSVATSRSMGTYKLSNLITDRHVQRALLYGCGLQALQQLVGINTVMYYSATVFSLAGFPNTLSIWLSALTALAQSISVLLGMFLTNRMARRRQLLLSLALVILSLLVLGFSFLFSDMSSGAVSEVHDMCQTSRSIWGWNAEVTTCAACVSVDGCGYCSLNESCIKLFANAAATDADEDCPAEFLFMGSCPQNQFAWLSVLGMIMYLAAFGIGMSGLPWTINAEIYPLHCRTMANSISTGVNWVCNILCSSTFLTIASPHVLTLYGAFWAYSGIGIIGWIGVYLALPETSGLTLEEIECYILRPRNEEESFLNHVKKKPIEGYGGTTKD